MTVSELLHNAVEHAQAGTVQVELARDAGSDELDLVVRDDGRGLPDGFDERETGLGLSIVQSLVTGDLHGTCAMEGCRVRARSCGFGCRTRASGRRRPSGGR